MVSSSSSSFLSLCFLHVTLLLCELDVLQAYVCWETKPCKVAVRGPYLVLFEKDGRFLEVRNTYNGQSVCVLEGKKMRLVGDDQTDKRILATNKNRESLFELLETVPIR